MIFVWSIRVSHCPTSKQTTQHLPTLPLRRLERQWMGNTFFEKVTEGEKRLEPYVRVSTIYLVLEWPLNDDLQGSRTSSTIYIYTLYIHILHHPMCVSTHMSIPNVDVWSIIYHGCVHSIKWCVTGVSQIRRQNFHVLSFSTKRKQIRGPAFVIRTSYEVSHDITCKHAPSNCAVLGPGCAATSCFFSPPGNER